MSEKTRIRDENTKIKVNWRNLSKCVKRSTKKKRHTWPDLRVKDPNLIASTVANSNMN